jgi:hypothetical protein
MALIKESVLKRDENGKWVKVTIERDLFTKKPYKMRKIIKDEPYLTSLFDVKYK